MTKINEWYEAKTAYLKHFYGNQAEEWKTCEGDRLTYCNIYNQIMEACEAVKEIDNKIVHVAMTDKINKETKILDEYLTRLAK